LEAAVEGGVCGLGLGRGRELMEKVYFSSFNFKTDQTTSLNLLNRAF
jgi:hypothetical protein